MNRLSFFVLVLLLSGIKNLQAGNIYKVDYPNQADVKVFIVEYPNQADLLVYVTNQILVAKDKDEIWHYVKYPNQSDIKVYFVDYPNQAEVKVYFVEFVNQARWRIESKNMGRFKL